MQFGEHIIPEDHIIVKTKYTFIFTNIRPFLPFHILVSPISKKQFLHELSEEETDDLFRSVRLSIICLKKYGTSNTINLQDGPEAGQHVNHLHVHVIPRNKNDIEYNDMIYEKGALDYVRSDRSYEEMKEEALRLRKKFEHTFKEFSVEIEKK